MSFGQPDFTLCVRATFGRRDRPVDIGEMRTLDDKLLFLRSIFGDDVASKLGAPMMGPMNLRNPKQRMWLIPLPKEAFEDEWLVLRNLDLIKEKDKIIWVSTFHQSIALIFDRAGERVTGLETERAINIQEEQEDSFPDTRNMLIEAWNSTLLETSGGYDKDLQMTMNGLRPLMGRSDLASGLNACNGRRVQDILEDYKDQMTICFLQAFPERLVEKIGRQRYHPQCRAYLIECNLDHLPGSAGPAEELKKDKRNGWVVTFSKPVAEIFSKQDFCLVLGITIKDRVGEISLPSLLSRLKPYYSNTGTLGGFIDELLTTKNVRLWLPLVNHGQLMVKPHGTSQLTISEYLQANP